tara:strand:+ start:515 stop:712 length:198 start_codon:yes stop_codon:yes gene_type:complete
MFSMQRGISHSGGHTKLTAAVPEADLKLAYLHMDDDVVFLWKLHSSKTPAGALFIKLFYSINKDV